MVDIHRLFGFVYYSNNNQVFGDMKNAIIHIAKSIEVDDIAIVQGEYCVGGAVVGQAINSRNYKDSEDFLITVKAVSKSISEINIACPKLVFIISDILNEDLKFTLHKLNMSNEKNNYPAKICHIFYTSAKGKSWLKEAIEGEINKCLLTNS